MCGGVVITGRAVRVLSDQGESPGVGQLVLPGGAGTRRLWRGQCALGNGTNALKRGKVGGGRGGLWNIHQEVLKL